MSVSRKKQALKKLNNAVKENDSSKKYLNESNKKLKTGFAFKELRYENPVGVLIRFEVTDHQKSISIMNKKQITFTNMVNQGLRYMIEHPELLK